MNIYNLAVPAPIIAIRPEITDCKEGNSLALCCTLAIAQEILRTTPSTVLKTESCSSSAFACASSDLFHFGRIWSSVRQHFTQEFVAHETLERRKEILAAKEHWKLKISLNPLQMEADALLKHGKLERSEQGYGAAYVLYDHFHFPCLIIKPTDEDLFCLNNSKQYGSPLLTPHLAVRDWIPLYRSHQTDALAYETAQIMGLSQITPETGIGFLKSETFFDLSERLEGTALKTFLDQGGNPDKEKLCSIQRFAYPSTHLVDTVQEWLDENLTDEEIQNKIDQKSFEEACLFIWTIFDTDAHAGNFLFKHVRDTYAILKIDNGLSFPEKNSGLHNFLAFLPNAQQKLSEQGKKTIASIPAEEIIARMRFYAMGAAIDAFQERIAILQQLAQKSELTLFDIDLRMQSLKCDDGGKIALSDLSREEIEVFLRKNKHEFIPRCSQEEDETYLY